MSESPNITLRRVTEDDREFLLAVYGSSRAAELAMVPWDDEQKRQFVEFQFEAQTRFYCEKNPAATHDVILFDAVPCGRLYVDRREDEIAIMDIIVLPEYRNRGIGTFLIEGLMAEAEGRFIGVYVETYNPSQKLFRELGFEAESETDINIHFCWRAAADQAA
ncbi:hypothetical protein BH10ACI3_BH10ACI3_21120 [soil metagenome]